MSAPDVLGIIAGNGVYPRLVAQNAHAAGVNKIVAAAFEGETDASLADVVDEVGWLRVGQLGRLLKMFRDGGVRHAIMAGQIAPKNLFDLRPDVRALVLLARLRRRNAESIFSAIAAELASADIELLDATTFIENSLAPPGLIAGRRLSRRERADIDYGWNIAKEIARLDIGQTVIVKAGTVLAVEGFDGTNATIARGGGLAKSGALMVKVAKPNQDMRFDVPVVGVETIRVAAGAEIRAIAIEAGKTLLLEGEAVRAAADRAGITLFAR